MKNRIMVCLLVVLLLATMTTQAYAIDSRQLYIVPTLYFEGSTAKCEVTVTGNYSTDEIDAVIKLWQGSTCIATWTESGKGYIFFDDSCNVTRNREYTLTVDIEINDVSRPRVSVTNKCG